MKIKDVDQYVALRAALQKEKAALEARLAEIDRALSGTGAGKPGRPAGVKTEPRRGKRAKNSMSLKEAAVKALGGKTLGRQEILDGVLALGYKFTAKKPLLSLSTLLYSDKSFKNVDGKFCVAK